MWIKPEDRCIDMVFLYTIVIFISISNLAFSENETLALNATAINNILTSKILVNGSLNESAVTDYLYGDSDTNDHQLDISVFEADDGQMLLETAQSKSEMMIQEFNKSRRYYNTPGFVANNYFVNKSIDFMMQSIYGTRYRLKDTRYIRKAFSGDIAYKIAILYGSLMQITIKLDNIYNTLRRFDNFVNSIWYLGLYERCIAMTVDANFMVERIFALRQEEHKTQDRDEGYIEMENPNLDKERFKPKLPPLG